MFIETEPSTAELVEMDKVNRQLKIRKDKRINVQTDKRLHHVTVKGRKNTAIYFNDDDESIDLRKVRKIGDLHSMSE